MHGYSARPDAGLVSIHDDPISAAHRAAQEHRRLLDQIDSSAKPGGPIPTQSPDKESFWAGYYNQAGTIRGILGSVQRRTYEAGQRRAAAEPNLNPEGPHQ